MKATGLNFRHLYYFWVVAKEGSVTRAAERLDVAVQTISAQLALLEQSVGKALLAPQGRRLALTEAGRIALAYADQIFLLGEQLQEALANSEGERTMRLAVGISDSVPKLISSRLLEAAVSLPERVKLVCYEDNFESLLGDLSVHKLDVVLTDRPVPSGTTLRVFGHLLGERDITGEFDDNALLNTFGRSGLGLFPAPTALTTDVREQFNAVAVGEIAQVHEQFYAISNERKIKHPAVEAILTAIHGKVGKKPSAK